jgi:hypothetical protein
MTTDTLEKVISETLTGTTQLRQLSDAELDRISGGILSDDVNPHYTPAIMRLTVIGTCPK